MGLGRRGTITGTVGALVAANNLSDVANATTANNNLGQDSEDYAPTVTPLAVVDSTITVNGLAQAILVNADSVSCMMKVTVEFLSSETAVDATITLPPSFLPTNNFTAKSDLISVISIYSEASIPNDNFAFALFANFANKNIYFSCITDGLNPTVELTIFFRYNKNN